MADIFNHYIIPTAFVLFFTPTPGLLVQYFKHDTYKDINLTAYLTSNQLSLIIVLVVIAWAWLFLIIPGKEFKGPTTYFGQTPIYRDNGFVFYLTSVAAFIGLNIWKKDMSVIIYHNMAEILGALSNIALVLCVYLLIKGKYYSSSKEKIPKAPLIHEFYRGMELHTKVLGVDIKQLTNCRVGLGLWQVLILNFLFASWKMNGSLNYPHLANVLLQSVYIAKFYWWETGYFDTLDMTLDRAGYYLCWGCLVWVPGFFTFSSYYLVTHRPTFSLFTSVAVIAVGLLFIWLNYSVDYQKQLFRTTNGNCQIFGKKAKFITANYKTHDNKVKQSKLLTSGFWGMARHMNYTFEILITLCMALPGMQFGICTSFYAVFISILVVHRIYRDEQKCSAKYGKDWQKYCSIVKWRLVPYLY